MLSSAKEIIDNWHALQSNNHNKYVSVDKTAAKNYARKLRETPKKVEHWHFKDIHPEDDLAFARFVLVTSTVNFCFSEFEEPTSKFTVENTRQHDRPFRGAMAMFHCFYRAFGENNITADDLEFRVKTLAKTSEFFNGSNVIPLFEHRHWILQEMASVLREKFAGDPMHIYEQANWDAVTLVELLAQNFYQGFGDDVACLYLQGDGESTAQELRFPFFKKAKLVALLYQGRALEEGRRLRPLRRMHEIIAVEDYRVPQMLHHQGILVYSEELLEEIKKRQILHRHSQAEIEIRAASTYANACILEELNQGLTPDAPDYRDIVSLDAQEWFDAQKATLPHHLTPTTAY